jgi:hypothetical protein
MTMIQVVRDGERRKERGERANVIVLFILAVGSPPNPQFSPLFHKAYRCGAVS